MSRLAVMLFPLALCMLALGVAGCRQQSPSTPPQTSGDAADTDGDVGVAQPAPVDSAASVAPQQEQAEALSQLSAADRALAATQKTCPVTGELLGSMGAPYKVTVKGQEVLLCCKGCETEVLENPDKYLAKLNQ